MKLADFCQAPAFSDVLLTTYRFDPLFFERVVLEDLRAGGAEGVVVVADARQALPVLKACAGQLFALGRDYRLILVRDLNGAFHPKVCVRLGRDSAVVSCGSANLTRAGWLGYGERGVQGNREGVSTWRVGPGSYAATQLRALIAGLVQSVDSPDDRDLIATRFARAWLTDAVVEGAPEPWAWFVSTRGRSLSSFLEQRWAGRRFHRLRMVTGSTDRAGALFRWAARTWGIREVFLEVDRATCSLTSAQLGDLPLDLRIDFLAGESRSHMKLAVFESEDGRATAVVGSANCSSAGWLLGPETHGNVEAVVVHDDCRAIDFASLFPGDPTKARSFRELTLEAAAEPDATGETTPTYALQQVLAQRTLGLLHVTAVPAPPRGVSIVLRLDDGSAVPLENKEGGEYSAHHDLADTGCTRFACAEIRDGASVITTDPAWIDDVERLEERAVLRRAARALGGIAASTPISQRLKVVEDLSALAEALFDPETEIPDGVRSAPAAAATKPDESARVLTPGDVVRKGAQDDTNESAGKCAAAALNGDLSLGGITRLLFGIETETANGASAEGASGSNETDQEDADEGKGSSGDERPSEPDDSLEEERARDRLLRHLEDCVDRLKNDHFVGACSARQLQQAVAYVLAAAALGKTGGWFKSADSGELDRTLTSLCEVMLYRTYPALTQPPRPAGALGVVRARYARDGRDDVFDTVIADGVLWLAFTAGVAALALAPSTAFERVLIVRDMAAHPCLKPAAEPERVRALAARLRRGGSLDLPAYASHAAATVGALEAELLRHKHRPARNGDSRPGDWLWNEKVRFARVVEVGDVHARVHVRRSAEEIPKVKLSIYVNVSELTRTNETVRRAFEACQDLPASLAK